VKGRKTVPRNRLAQQNRAVRRLPTQLASSRLLLRPWRDDDAQALARAITTSIDHLRPWMPWIAAEPLDLGSRVDLIDRWRLDWEAGGDAVYGAFLDGAIVGGCGLHRRSGDDVLEIGYWIHVDHVRCGLATEMAATLTTAAFAEPGIEFVEIHHDKANTASAGIPRALGYTLESERPDPITAPGEVGIDCSWRVRRVDWPVDND
jgi:ribosomal-protein-serine acetyltransferase